MRAVGVKCFWRRVENSTSALSFTKKRNKSKTIDSAEFGGDREQDLEKDQIPNRISTYSLLW